MFLTRVHSLGNDATISLCNRQNPYHYYFSFDGDETGKSERKPYQQSLFPFIPPFNYSFKIS